MNESHPDAEDAERGFGLSEQELRDWRWVVALDALERNDARELAKLLIDGAPAPRWARNDLAQRYGLPLPYAELERQREPLKPEDVKLLRAAHVFCVDNDGKKLPIKSPEREDAIKRVAVKHGVTASQLENYLNCQGRPYLRIRAYFES